jgi:hypothetical protein
VGHGQKVLCQAEPVVAKMRSCRYLHCPLTLIICRPGRKGLQPWYLRANEKVENDKQAWKLVHAYARRWQYNTSAKLDHELS